MVLLGRNTFLSPDRSLNSRRSETAK